MPHCLVTVVQRYRDGVCSPLLTLSAHAQRRLQYLLCVSVCLSVCLSVCVCVCLAATAFISACNERNLRHYYRLFLDSSSWIFEKPSVQKLWREKANELEIAASRFRALSGPAKHRDHLQDNLSVESCFRRKVLAQPPRNK